MAPVRGLLANHTYANSLGINIHCCGNSQSIVTSLHSRYTQSLHFLCNPNSKVVSTKPKLWLQNSVWSKFSCLKGGENL